MGIFLCKEDRLEDLCESLVNKFEGESIAVLADKKIDSDFFITLSKFVNIDLNPEILSVKHRAIVAFYSHEFRVERLYNVPCIYVFQSLLDFVKCDIIFDENVTFLIDTKSVLKTIYKEIVAVYSYVVSYISLAENLLYNDVILGLETTNNVESLINAIKEFLGSINEGKINAVNIKSIINSCKKFVKIKNKYLSNNLQNLALVSSNFYEKITGEKCEFLKVYFQNIFAKINEKFLKSKVFNSVIPSSYFATIFKAENYNLKTEIIKDFLTYCDNKIILKNLSNEVDNLIKINASILNVSSDALNLFEKLEGGLKDNVCMLDIKAIKSSLILAIENGKLSLPKIIKNLGYFDDFD